MTTEMLTVLVLAWAHRELPPERYALFPTYPEAQETAKERTDRYQEIAQDIAEVVSEGQNTPATSRRYTASLLFAIAIHESGLAKDVDVGPCAPERLKKGGCDGGRAASLWQIQGYDVPTRRDAARIALRLARRSLMVCRDLPPPERLAAYAAGNCASKMGRFRSSEIYSLQKRLLATPVPPRIAELRLTHIGS